MINKLPVPRTLITLGTIAAAGFVLVLMNASADLINALLLSWILVLIASPLLRRLKRRMPNWLAFLITLATIFGVFMVIGLLLVVGFNRFIEAIPAYAEEFDSLVDNVNELLASFGLSPGDISAVGGFINPEAFLEVIGNFLAGLIGTIGNIVLIILFVVFLLLDASNAPKKLVTQIKEGHTGLERLFKASGLLREYVVLATIVTSSPKVSIIAG